MIAQALKSKETRRSTIKVAPTFKWPILGDDGPDAKEVEEFYEKYEDLCRLANDGRGMSAMEHLTTLVSCLRGSKEKIYRIVYKKHRKLGTVAKDPDAVFAEIRERHMRFIETPMERQMRVLGEWDGLWKGNRSALQFEAVFEETITELELAGLAKNERELLLGYLQKIGPQLAAEVQKDVRSWTNREGLETSRRVSSWEEAHRVHVEIEAIKASGRALVPAYVLGGGKSAGKGGGGKPSGLERAEAPSSRPVCHEMRDKNTCRFGDSCRYSHDPQTLKEARKAAKSSLPDAAPLEAKGKGKGKPKTKAKGRGKDGKGGGRAPAVSRVEFLTGCARIFGKDRSANTAKTAGFRTRRRSSDRTASSKEKEPLPLEVPRATRTRPARAQKVSIGSLPADLARQDVCPGRPVAPRILSVTPCGLVRLARRSPKES